MYWWHRLNHIAPWLWYFHKLHHTDTQLNITSTFRFHTGELLLSYIFKLFFFLLLGIQLFPILVYGIIFLPVVMFHHSNIKVSDNIQRILGYVIVVPNIHRIHHSKIIKETNSNFSSIFSFWDKIFITFTDKPKNKTINFGL
jgi:sterol desaturase/sphingolipid hydroxylase (fatty acid hydroxylase superfamily)